MWALAPSIGGRESNSEWFALHCTAGSHRMLVNAAEDDRDDHNAHRGARIGFTASGPSRGGHVAPAAHATWSDAAGSHGGVSVPGMAHGNLGFRDQVSAGRTLVGLAEIDGSGGWVVVREDRPCT